MRLISKKQLGRELERARSEGYNAGVSELPLVHVAAHDLAGARLAARRLEHPNGDRGRAIHAVKREDIQGYRGGILLRGWGADDAIVKEARLCGMLIINAFE